VRIRNRFALGAMGWVFASLIRLLFCTLRRQYREEVAGVNPYVAPRDGEGFLYCVWHDSMVMPAFGGRHERMCALTSQHTDGSFVAAVLKRIKVRPIRGSTNRMGIKAMRELFSAADTGHVVMTPDGPRGPARKISLGIVYLASRTGRAIVPTAYRCQRPWRIKGSWSDLLIPQPFSKVEFIAGKPIYVPADLNTDELGHYVELVQAEMDRLHGAIVHNNPVIYTVPYYRAV